MLNLVKNYDKSATMQFFFKDLENLKQLKKIHHQQIIIFKNLTLKKLIITKPDKVLQYS
jgi:hypothetical protein